MRTSNELQIGKAGEYLVCADLIMKGLVAFPSEQGLPYDVLIDTGERLLRCQVKTAEKPRKTPQRKSDYSVYIYNIKRHGKNNKSRYTDKEIDVFALVALDCRMVSYLENSDMPSTINLRVDALKGSYYDEKGIKDYAKISELIADGKTQSEAARIIGIAAATVNKMCKKDYFPHVTKAKYFSDLLKDKSWFERL